jgi:hypothetical protein
MLGSFSANELVKHIDMGMDVELSQGGRAWWIGRNQLGEGHAAGQTIPPGDDYIYPNGEAVLSRFLIDGVPLRDQIDKFDIWTSF